MAWFDYAEVEPTPCCGIDFITNVWQPEAVPPKEERQEVSYLLITGGKREDLDPDTRRVKYIYEDPATMKKLRKEGFKPLKKFRSRTTGRVLTLWFRR